MNVEDFITIKLTKDERDRLYKKHVEQKTALEIAKEEHYLYIKEMTRCKIGYHISPSSIKYITELEKELEKRK